MDVRKLNISSISPCGIGTMRSLQVFFVVVTAQGASFVCAQADAHGLTRRGLIMDENGRIRKATGDNITLAEYHLGKRRTVEETNFLTQKAELRLAARTAASRSDSFEGFCRYMTEAYGIKVKLTRGEISLQHPERIGERGGGWIRGRTLGAKYTKEAINGFIQQTHRRITVEGGIKADGRSNWRSRQGEYSRNVGAYVSLDGLKDVTLISMTKCLGGRPVICTDNDKGGNRFREKYVVGMGYDTLIPNELYGKDWNDELKAVTVMQNKTNGGNI